MRIFVSHSHADNTFGVQLVGDLRVALGSEDSVWYDASGGLHGGDAWWNKILGEIVERPVFLVILSPDSMQSPWVNDEINLAWKLKNSPQGKRIMPVLLRPCEVRHDVAMLQFVSFARPRPYSVAFGELLQTLGSNAPLGSTPPSGRPVGTPPTHDFARYPDASSTAPSTKGQRYQEFYRALASELRARGLAFTPTTIDQASYCQFSSGFAGTVYIAAFTGKGEVRISFDISRDDNKALFDALHRYQAQIEQSFGQPLSWERKDRHMMARIAAYYPGGGSIFDDANRLASIRQWMSDNMLRLQNALTSALRQLAR